MRGRVTRLPGASAALRANLILPGPQPVTTSAVVAPDGAFEFLNVRPGNYNLSLSVPVPFRQIVVGNTDMTGIEFTVPPMRSTQGIVSMEDAGAAPQRVIVQVTHPSGTVSMNAVVQPGGSFNVLLPEGEHRIGVVSPGYLVRALTHGTADLLREPLRLSNTDSAPLTVTLVVNPAGTTPPGFPQPIGLRGTPPPPALAAPTTEPVLLSRVDPQYTDQARQARLSGAVRLTAVVRRDGTVDAVQVVQGLGMGLDEAAIAAVRQWRFRPATRNGEAVDSAISLAVTFNLK
ncbi:MAG TPA: TonB family protein [Terriglobia bacterium]|nr:TonB family protein [Terriglobia bacterium]